ncbi:hypothetical protein HNR56_003815 [Roseospira marina]|nr:hypothetical protein [Roseospira marina]MBB5089100.1 hypothetical protein [Roseospira marina]
MTPLLRSTLDLYLRGIMGGRWHGLRSVAFRPWRRQHLRSVVRRRRRVWPDDRRVPALPPTPVRHATQATKGFWTDEAAGPVGEPPHPAPGFEGERTHTPAGATGRVL